MLTWGATAEEAKRPLTDDDFVADPQLEATHAVTIHAPPSDLWPWLVQIGHQRAGWQSYDWFHRALAVASSVEDERRPAERIVSTLHDLEVGDVVEISPGMGHRVVDLQPDRVPVTDRTIRRSVEGLPRLTPAAADSSHTLSVSMLPVSFDQLRTSRQDPCPWSRRAI